MPYGGSSYGQDLRESDAGLAVRTERGRIVEVSASVAPLDDDASRAVASALRTSRKAGRIARLEDQRVTIRATAMK
ncbi:MAG: hypothetical protein ACM31C_18545 [Acidobacteriota bacterium]